MSAKAQLAATPPARVCQVPPAERWKAAPLAAHQEAVTARAAADETSPAAAPASP